MTGSHEHRPTRMEQAESIYWRVGQRKRVRLEQPIWIAHSSPLPFASENMSPVFCAQLNQKRPFRAGEDSSNFAGGDLRRP